MSYGMTFNDLEIGGGIHRSYLLALQGAPIYGINFMTDFSTPYFNVIGASSVHLNGNGKILPSSVYQVNGVNKFETFVGGDENFYVSDYKSSMFQIERGAPEKSLQILSNGNIRYAKLISSYNGAPTVGNGASVSYFQDDQTDLDGSRGPITLLAGSDSSGGHWSLCYAEEVTATSSDLAQRITFSVRFTSHAIRRTLLGAPLAVNSTANSEHNCIPMNVDDRTDISYAVTASGDLSGARYAVDVWLKKE